VAIISLDSRARTFLDQQLGDPQSFHLGGNEDLVTRHQRPGDHGALDDLPALGGNHRHDGCDGCRIRHGGGLDGADRRGHEGRQNQGAGGAGKTEGQGRVLTRTGRDPASPGRPAF